MCVVVTRVITTLIVAAAYVVAAPPPVAPKISSYDLFMPNVQPKEPDTYICNAVRVDEAHKYMVGFNPRANSHDAHHMLLYGCEEPGMAPGNIWNCGEMSSSMPKAKTAGVCRSGHSILYAWAMDAPKLKLPPGVGFDIGQDTAVKYLVLQVHYKNVSKFVSPNNGTDDSGLRIQMSDERMPKQAGVYLLATGGLIPAHSIEYFESACEFKDDKEIVPFAFRTHAHSLGRVISGYRIRDGQWTELGRKDPRLPEMFYNVTTPGATIQKGDILAARCTMENTKDHTVKIGNTQNDEMCNFYIMYYVDTPPIPTTKQCVTRGPPNWSWKNFEDSRKMNLAGIPATASEIPQTKQRLVKTTGNANEPYDPLFGADGGNSMGGETMEDEVEGDDLLPKVPGAFQEQTVEEILDEAINDMNPDELLYIIQQLAREEEENETWKQIWQQRQRMRGQNAYPYYPY